MLNSYPHQIESLKFALTHPRCALLLDMGLGKTKVDIDHSFMLWSKGRIKTWLIVCPLSVMDVWVDELHKHAQVEEYNLVTIYGSRLKREKLFFLLSELIESSDAKLVIGIINYDAVVAFYEELVKVSWTKITCDESTKIKNARTRRSKAVFKLAETLQVPYRSILTGTIMTETIQDTFSQYKFLDPSVFGVIFWRFKATYLVMGGYGGYEIVGYRNLADFNVRLRSRAIIFKAKDCLQLPAVTTQVRRIPLHADQQKIYNQMKKEAIVEIQEFICGSPPMQSVAPYVLTKIIRLNQITDGFLKMEDGSITTLPRSAKMDELAELLDDLVKEGRKIIIWARFIKSLDLISTLLANRRVAYGRLDGTVSKKTRDDYISDFKLPNGSKVLVGQPRTGGWGLNLTEATVAIYYSNEYSAEARLQSEKRIHRIGQMYPVLYVDLVAKGTVDEVILQMLNGKQRLTNIIMDAVKTGDNSKIESLFV